MFNEENKECLVGPLPSSVVLGTVNFVAKESHSLTFLSLRQANKSKDKWNIPKGSVVSFR